MEPIAKPSAKPPLSITTIAKSPEYRAAWLEVGRCFDAGLAKDDPRMVRAWARHTVAHYTPLLAHVEAMLAGGVCIKGPRKGQPFTPRHRRSLERWAGNLRSSLAHSYAQLDSVEPPTVQELVEGVIGAEP